MKRAVLTTGVGFIPALNLHQKTYPLHLAFRAKVSRECWKNGKQGRKWCFLSPKTPYARVSEFSAWGFSTGCY